MNDLTYKRLQYFFKTKPTYLINESNICNFIKILKILK